MSSQFVLPQFEPVRTEYRHWAVEVAGRREELANLLIRSMATKRCILPSTVCTAATSMWGAIFLVQPDEPAGRMKNT